MLNGIEDLGRENIFELGDNVSVKGRVDGNNNRVVIERAAATAVVLHIHGNNNVVKLDRGSSIKGLTLFCGTHVPAHHTMFRAGLNCSIEPGARVYLSNSHNRCIIGDHCLISNNLTIRCGELPYLIFDQQTGKYLDVSEGVEIGHHVWIGEQVYLTKNVTIPNECIVAARSVVTKRFKASHSVLGGNPAHIVRSGVQWVRNASYLEEGSIYKEGYKRFNKTSD